MSLHSIKANHAKAWDAKPLAYVQRHALNTVAGLPGGHSSSVFELSFDAAQLSRRKSYEKFSWFHCR